MSTKRTAHNSEEDELQHQKQTLEESKESQNSEHSDGDDNDEGEDDYDDDEEEIESKRKHRKADIEKSLYLEKFLPFYSMTDFSKFTNFKYVILLRAFQELFLTSSMLQPDEYWQGTEVAYNIVFGGVKLPWEWHSEYSLRNVLYPYYLSIPLWILRLTFLDFQPLVLAAPYIAHLPLVLLADYFYFQAGKKAIGETGVRISVYFYLSNGFFNAFLIRTFSNSLEAILHIVSFNYFFSITS